MKKVAILATLLGVMLSPFEAIAAIDKKHIKHHHERSAHHTKIIPHEFRPFRQTGKASWYGYESGNRTANGERFDPNRMTAAHRTLRLPSKVRVTNLRTHRSVDVRVNDRGPYVRGRVIDLSLAAAMAIGLKGVDVVRIVAIE